MRTIILTRGLPASGKSTWARGELRAHPERWVRVNNDDIIDMLYGQAVSHTPETGKVLEELRESVIRTALRKGRDVIVDNTHLSGRSIKAVCDIAQSVGDVLVTVKTFPEKLDVCIARDAARPKPVGAPVIEGMWKKYGLKNGFSRAEDRYFEPIVEGPTAVQDPKLPEAIIVDLDGTAALIGDRNPYDASRCDEVDLPNVPVIETALTMHLHRGTKIVFVSGRDEKYRDPTVRFIEKHFRVRTPEPCDGSEPSLTTVTIPYELHMRPAGDTRKDTLIKKEIYEREVKGKVRVLFVLDDRDVVVAMWRKELGLSVFQVNYGCF